MAFSLSARLHPRFRHVLKQNLKYEARRNRRAQERQLLAQTAQDVEDVVFPTKNQHVSDVWNWD